jgi:protein-S-isoprenylcysteine O-methyltransferase Ste14
MNSFLKWYLPIFLILYIMVSFVWPTYKTWKKTGINPITFGNEPTAHNYIGKLMKITIILLFINVIIFSLFSKAYSYLLPFQFPNHWFFIFGVVIVHAALIFITIAQYQMGINWRIGIDELNKTTLITSGIFKISRNPIFLGMIVSVWGLFLLIPNVLSLFIAIFTYILIQIQVRLEEVYLQNVHGNEYKLYQNKTPRLL